MNIEELRSFCLSLPEVEESLPFGIDTLVFKTNSKIFLLCSLDRQPLSFNVKCEPLKAVELREQYDSILPGYHMNKKHWNTVIIDGSVPLALLKQIITDSYNLVRVKPTKK